MNADEFRDYILGFIFYKYLSEKINIYTNTTLKPDGILFTDIKGEAVEKLGYFLKPNELFSEIAVRGKEDFLNAGGETYKHISCLNDNDDWVNVMVQWIEDWHKEKTVII